jgi:hypothetical protein
LLARVEASAAETARVDAIAREEASATHDRHTRALENAIEELRVEWAHAHAAAEAQCDRLACALKSCESTMEAAQREHSDEISRARGEHVEAAAVLNGRTRCALAAAAATEAAHAARGAACAAASGAAHCVHIDVLETQCAAAAAQLDAAQQHAAALAATHASRFAAVRAALRASTDAAADAAAAELCALECALVERACASNAALERGAAAQLDAARATSDSFLAASDAAAAEALRRCSDEAERAASAALAQFQLECASVGDLRARCDATDAMAASLSAALSSAELHSQRDAALHGEVTAALQHERVAAQVAAQERARVVERHARAASDAAAELESREERISALAARCEQRGVEVAAAHGERDAALRELRGAESDLALARVRAAALEAKHAAHAEAHASHVERGASAHAATERDVEALQAELATLRGSDVELRTERAALRAGEAHAAQRAASLVEEHRLECRTAAAARDAAAQQSGLAAAQSEARAAFASRAHDDRVVALEISTSALEARLSERTSALESCERAAVEAELRHARGAEAMRASVAASDLAAAIARAQLAPLAIAERNGASKLEAQADACARARAELAEESLVVARVRSSAEADVGAAARAIESLHARIARLERKRAAARHKLHASEAEQLRLTDTHGVRSRDLSAEMEERDEAMRSTLERLLAEREAEHSDARKTLAAQHEAAVEATRVHSEQWWCAHAESEVQSEARLAALQVRAASAATATYETQLAAAAESFQLESEAAAAASSALLSTHESKFAAVAQTLRAEVEELRRRDGAMRAERDACLDAARKATAHGARAREKAKRVETRCKGALVDVEQRAERKQMLLVLSLSDAQHALADARAAASPDYAAHHRAQEFAAQVRFSPPPLAFPSRRSLSLSLSLSLSRPCYLPRGSWLATASSCTHFIHPASDDRLLVCMDMGPHDILERPIRRPPRTHPTLESHRR